MAKTQTSQAKKTILPFPAWVEKKYPKKTPARSFLQMIGALDVAYLMYRMNKQPETSSAVQPVMKIPVMPLKVEDYKRPAPKKQTKPRTKKPTKPKKVEQDEGLTMEFEYKAEPLPSPGRQAGGRRGVGGEAIEPEPLVLQEEPIVKKPAKVSRSKTAWLDDERLEDIDLRKTDLKLETNGIAVAFETSHSDDEEETVIVVNDVSWRALLTSPALNLSKMLQVAKVSYGELYVLGRMALGAMSGEGYIDADEAARIVSELSAAKNKTVELDVQYHDKDKTSKKRSTNTMVIRFERVS